MIRHSEKPIKAKPNFYAHCFYQLKQIAEEYGYNLVLHGSINRDLYLIAIPWVDNPKDEWDMIKAFSMHLKQTEPNEKTDALYSVLPGGRKNYVIQLNRGGAWNNYVDNQYYVDISVTPLPKNL